MTLNNNHPRIVAYVKKDADHCVAFRQKQEGLPRVKKWLSFDNAPDNFTCHRLLHIKREKLNQLISEVNTSTPFDFLLCIAHLLPFFGLLTLFKRGFAFFAFAEALRAALAAIAAAASFETPSDLAIFAVTALKPG